MSGKSIIICILKLVNPVRGDFGFSFEPMLVEKTTIQMTSERDSSIWRKTMPTGQGYGNQKEVKGNRGQNTALLYSNQHIKRVRHPATDSCCGIPAEM